MLTKPPKMDPMEAISIWLPLAGALVGIGGTILAARGKGDASIGMTLSWSLLTGIGATAAAYGAYKRDQRQQLLLAEQRARLETLETSFGQLTPRT